MFIIIDENIKCLIYFFLINILLSVGYFAYFMFSYSKSISIGTKINLGIINHWFNLYKTLFYVWLGLSLVNTAAILIIFIIKQIKY